MKRIALFGMFFCLVYALAAFLPAVIFAQAGSSPQDAGAAGQLSTQVVINYLAVIVIQWAKKNRSALTSWIGLNTPWVSRTAAAIAAAATAAGISGSFEAGVLTVQGLTVMGALHFGGYFLQNWAGMKIIYKVMHPSGPAWDGETERRK